MMAAAPSADEGPPAQLALGQPLFIPGESMVFELTLRNVVGGRAAIVVGEPGRMNGQPVLIVRSLVESAGVAAWFQTVRNDVQTWVDTATGVAIEHRGESRRGKKQARALARFAPGGTGVVIEYERSDKPRTIHRKAMPAGQQVHDFHSAMGLLRAWMPRPGERLYYYTANGKRIWRTDLRYMGSETVRTAMGMLPAMRFEGVSIRLDRKLEPDSKKPPRPFTFWFSDDDLRMPLRLKASTEYGDFMAELVDYQRPDPQISQRY